MTPIRLTISSKCGDGDRNHASITITPVKVQSRSQYCKAYLEQICFWGSSTTFSIVETDVQDSTRPKQVVNVGEVSSLVYRRLCPDLSFEYALENATEYLEVHGNMLRTTRSKAIDHDTNNPGPALLVKLNCNVKLAFDTPIVTISQVVQVNILDKNDNYPEHHNSERNIYLKDPHLKNVSAYLCNLNTRRLSPIIYN